MQRGAVHIFRTSCVKSRAVLVRPPCSAPCKKKKNHQTLQSGPSGGWKKKKSEQRVVRKILFFNLKLEKENGIVVLLSFLVVGGRSSCGLVAKNFQDSPSHQIFRHMHEVLNIHENKNYLHNSSVNREINLLSLDTL